MIWFDLIDLIDFWCFNAIFSNISAISWRPVLVVKEAGVRGENHRTGKLYHLRLRVECTFFCYLQSRPRTHAVLVIGLYEFLVRPVLLVILVFCFALFYLSSSCVLCAQCCQRLWIVHSWLPLRFSLTFILLSSCRFGMFFRNFNNISVLSCCLVSLVEKRLPGEDYRSTSH